MPTPDIALHRPLSEVDEKKYDSTDVVPADADAADANASATARGQDGINLKKLIRRVDYRLLPSLGLLYVGFVPWSGIPRSRDGGVY
jgi:hypothetical protein